MSGQIPQSVQTPDAVETRLGTLSFRDGAPSPEAAFFDKSWPPSEMKVVS